MAYLDKHIEDLVRLCLSCQSNQDSPAVAPLQHWPCPAKPWQHIHIDFVGLFLDKMSFLVVDAHSKWPKVFEMPSTTSFATIYVLRHLFASYGLPCQLALDNGPQFCSEEFAIFLNTNWVRHIHCAPYHPASNGLVEHFVRTFKQALKACEPSSLSLHHIPLQDSRQVHCSWDGNCVRAWIYWSPIAMIMLSLNSPTRYIIMISMLNSNSFRLDNMWWPAIVDQDSGGVLL